jgi:alkylated DNA repair dioxygenase AlkB
MFTNLYHKEFISEKEEKEIVGFLTESKVKWNTDLSRRTLHFGYRYGYYGNGNALEKVDDIPEIFAKIIKRIITNKLMDKADQLIVNEYLPGQGIAPHTDNIIYFDDNIATISLNSDYIMNFTLTSDSETSDSETKEHLLLERRSLLLMRGDLRYKWKHSIAKRKTETINGKRINRGVRYSLTFRKIKK